jgi:hypothetical protein
MANEAASERWIRTSASALSGRSTASCAGLPAVHGSLEGRLGILRPRIAEAKDSQPDMERHPDREPERTISPLYAAEASEHAAATGSNDAEANEPQAGRNDQKPVRHDRTPGGKLAQSAARRRSSALYRSPPRQSMVGSRRAPGTAQVVDAVAAMSCQRSRRNGRRPPKGDQQ